MSLPITPLQPTEAEQYAAEWAALTSAIRHAANSQSSALRALGKADAVAQTMEASGIALAAIRGLARAARQIGTP